MTRIVRPIGPAKPNAAPVVCSTVAASASATPPTPSTLSSLASLSVWSPRTRTATVSPASVTNSSVLMKRSGGRARKALTSSILRCPGVATARIASSSPARSGAGTAAMAPCSTLAA